jgi:hypothetical protein
MTQVFFSARLKRKAELFEGRLDTSFSQKLRLIAEMTTESLLRDSHFIKGTNQPAKLLVTRLSGEYRLIFRQISSDSIEVVDVVSHEDLEKFAGGRG